MSGNQPSMPTGTTEAAQYQQCLEQYRAQHVQEGSYLLSSAQKYCAEMLLRSAFHQDPIHQLVIYGIILLTSLSLIFFGPQYKRLLYASLGSYPVWLVATRYKGDIAEFFEVAPKGASVKTNWFSNSMTQFDVMFLTLTTLTAFLVGLAAVKWNKVALAAVGGILTALLVLGLNLDTHCAPWFYPVCQALSLSKDWAPTIPTGLLTIFGAILFVCCFSKVFRNIVPLVAGILSADSICCLLIALCSKLSFGKTSGVAVWLSQNVFKEKSKLLLKHFLRGLCVSSSSNRMKDVQEKTQKAFAERLNLNLQLPNFAEYFTPSSVGENLPIWGLWLLLAVFFYCVGHAKMKTADCAEEEEEEEETVSYRRRRRASSASSHARWGTRRAPVQRAAPVKMQV